LKCVGSSIVALKQSAVINLVNFIQYPFGDVRSTDEMIGMLTATFASAPLGQKFLAGREIG
jgi:hypothetical protein